MTFLMSQNDPAQQWNPKSVPTLTQLPGRGRKDTYLLSMVHPSSLANVLIKTVDLSPALTRGILLVGATSWGRGFYHRMGPTMTGSVDSLIPARSRLGELLEIKESISFC